MVATVANKVLGQGLRLTEGDMVASVPSVVLIDPITGNPATPSNRTIGTLVIANGTSVSPTLDLTNTAILGFVMPSAWTTAALSIEVSLDNSTWYTPYDADSLPTGYFAAPAVSGAYTLNYAQIIPWRYIRFRSGTTAVPVNQGAARTLTYVTRVLA